MRFKTLLLAMLISALPVASAASTFRVMTGSHGPKDEVQVARPTFKWEIWPSTQPGQVTSVDFRIDGKAVAAKYAPAERAVVYTPERPLPSGSHTVKVEVVFNKVYKFNKTWTTVVSSKTILFPAATTEQREALSWANSFRSASGLPGMVLDDTLNLAAQKHSDYLTRNNMTGHYQSAGKPGFLGVSTSDRLAALGWGGGSWEGVTFGSRTVADGLRSLFDAPYHRLPFLQPGPVSFGAGYAGTRVTVNFGVGSQSGTVVSPANGQKNVPVQWRNHETPNPLRMHTTTQMVGYPIVLSHFSDQMAKIRITSANLTMNGQPVPVFLNTPENDQELTFAAILFPKHPLKPGTSYRASFAGTDGNGKPISVSTTFTTAL